MFYLKPEDFTKLLNQEQTQCKLSSLLSQYNGAVLEYTTLQRELKDKLTEINGIVGTIQYTMTEQTPPTKDRSQFFNLMKNFLSFHENTQNIMRESIKGNVLQHLYLDVVDMAALKNDLVDQMHKNSKLSQEYIQKLQLKDSKDATLDMAMLKQLEQQRIALNQSYANYAGYFKKQNYKELFEPSIMLLLYQLNYFQMNYHSLNDHRKELDSLLNSLIPKETPELIVPIETSNYNFNPLSNPLKFEKEPKGYLYKQTTSFKRFYFQLNYYEIENGFLYETELPKFEKSSMMDKINDKILKKKLVNRTMIMDLKYCMSKAHTHPFSFIVKRGLKQPEQDEFIFFTENPDTFKQWTIWLQRGIQDGLNRNDDGQPKPPSSASMSPLSPEENEYQSSKKLTTSIHETNGNTKCCDCGAEDEQNPPEWVSTNLGIILCIECSGIHRGLGTEISKVRSLTLDSWDQDLAHLMAKLGNSLFNQFYTEQVYCDSKDKREIRLAHILEKHVKRTYLKPIVEDPSTLLSHSLESHSFDQALLAMLHGADIKYKDPSTGLSLLHTALKNRNILAIEFILQWSGNSNLSAIDNNHNTPLHYCCMYNYPKYASICLKRGANQDVLNGDGKVLLNSYRHL